MPRVAMVCPTWMGKEHIVNFCKSLCTYFDKRYYIAIYAQEMSGKEIEVLKDIFRTYKYDKFVIENFPKQKGIISFTKLFHDACDFAEKTFGNIDYFNLCDHDFIFQENSQLNYEFGIEYMEENQQCGITYHSGFKGMYWAKKEQLQIDKIKPIFGGMPWRDKGMIVRNIGKNDDDYIYHQRKDCINLIGSWEEHIVLYGMLSGGYYPAIIKCCPTIHNHHHKRRDKTGTLALDYDIHSPELSYEVLDKVREIIGEYFDPMDWLKTQTGKGKYMHQHHLPAKFRNEYIEKAREKFGYCALMGEEVKYCSWFKKQKRDER